MLEKLIDKFLRILSFTHPYNESFYIFFILSSIIQTLNEEEYKDFVRKNGVFTPAFAGFTEENLPSITYTPELINFLKEFKKTKEEDAFYNLSKHEVLHLIALHPYRIAEYIKERNLPLIPETISFLCIIADSLVNKYVDPIFVMESGGVPPFRKDHTLEEIADMYLKKAEELLKSGKNALFKDNCNFTGKIKKALELLKKELGFRDGKMDIFEELIKKFFSKSAEELRENMRHAMQEVQNIIEQIEKLIGNIPGCLIEIIKEWKDVKIEIENENEFMSEFCEVERLYLLPNFLCPDLPVYRPFKNSKVLLILDTSGSIGKDEAEYFFGLIKNISVKYEVLVIEIDTLIRNEKPYKFPRFSNLFKEELIFKGRGGTNFRDLERLDKILSPSDREGISKVILLTDGQVEAFPSSKPLKKSEWIGVTTDIIPETAPLWIKRWFHIKKIRKFTRS